MAGAGWRTFTSGAVLTAAQVQTFLQDQAVQVYATTAARSSALGTAVSAGMVSFITTGSQLDVYANGAWTGLNYTSISNSTVSAYTVTAGDHNRTFVSASTAAAESKSKKRKAVLGREVQESTAVHIKVEQPARKIPPVRAATPSRACVAI
jgi:hypothetical protein